MLPKKSVFSIGGPIRFSNAKYNSQRKSFIKIRNCSSIFTHFFIRYIIDTISTQVFPKLNTESIFEKKSFTFLFLRLVLNFKLTTKVYFIRYIEKSKNHGHEFEKEQGTNNPQSYRMLENAKL